MPPALQVNELHAFEVFSQLDEFISTLIQFEHDLCELDRNGQLRQ